MSEYKIIFGKEEKEAGNNSYNNMSVDLYLKAGDESISASVLFAISEGYPDGQFDMSRSHASKSLSIAEAELLAAKLTEFAAKAKKFMEFVK